MITVFTPTYNRAYIIERLYNSLLRQTNKNFEWLIIDDGSSDNTDVLINEFCNEQKINIRYYKQSNGGKHRAINKGVSLAKGELFFIVDSDDQLADSAIDKLLKEFDSIKSNNVFAGISGLRANFKGQKIGGEQPFDIIDCNALDIRYKYNIKGDLAEAYKTEILKQYPFPEISHEKFCPEALVWNRIAKHYKLRYIYEKIYLCDYLPDGLTAKITKLRMNSPEASLMCYAELSQLQIPRKQKLKAAVNFWRFSFNSKRNFLSKLKQIGCYYLLLLPFGFLIHQKDKK